MASGVFDQAPVPAVTTLHTAGAARAEGAGARGSFAGKSYGDQRAQYAAHGGLRRVRWAAPLRINLRMNVFNKSL